MQYVVNNDGNKTGVLLSIKEYNELLELKNRYILENEYEETEDDLILTDKEKEEIKQLRVERRKGNLKKL